MLFLFVFDQNFLNAVQGIDLENLDYSGSSVGEECLQLLSWQLLHL